MNFLMVSVHFDVPGDPVRIGGVQKHISKVTEELKKAGHSVEWRYPASNTDYIPFDVVVFHDFSSYDMACEKPNIIIFHGWEGVYPPDIGIVKKRQAINTHANYSINIGRFIEELYGTKPDLTLYGGVDLPVNNEILDCIPKTAVYIGRLEPDNYPEEALQYAYNQGWRVDVLGDGSLGNILEIKFPYFNFHGFVGNVGEWIDKSQYVLCGGYLSILEAMIRKKPVIAFYGDNKGREIYLNSLPDEIKIATAATEKNLGDVSKFVTHDIIEENYKWAKEQTWGNVARKYIEAGEKIISEAKI